MIPFGLARRTARQIEKVSLFYIEVPHALGSGADERHDPLQQPAVATARRARHNVARELHAVVVGEGDRAAQPAGVVRPAEARAVRHPVLCPELI